METLIHDSINIVASSEENVANVTWSDGNVSQGELNRLRVKLEQQYGTGELACCESEGRRVGQPFENCVSSNS